MATTILFDFCIMSGLLLVAKIIRTKVKFIQKLYIPTALLSGVFGLIFGPQVLKLLPFSSEIGNYAGILICVLFATMFLGNKAKASFKKMINDVGETFLVNCAAEVFQWGFFLLVGIIVLPLIFKGINTGFGLMLPAGFVGGHGTAAAIGNVLAENGWEEAASIGQTFATIGLLSGIIGGVIFINIFARKGETKAIKSVNELPEEMLTGLVSEDKQIEVGKETTSPMSIDTITWHLLLVLCAVGLAYLANKGLKVIFPKISFPTYGLALIFSIGLQYLLKLFKLDKYVDKKTISHIGSSSTDFLVGFGVASINISVVAKYWLPIIVVAILGLVVVILFLLLISRKFFSNYWFERGIYIFGMSTGVLATGAILLRICDPEFKTGVLEDFGFAWIFMSIVDMLCVSLAPMFLLTGWGIVFSCVLIVLSIICLAVCKLISNKKVTSD